jgi:hypothetical protein
VVSGTGTVEGRWVVDETLSSGATTREVVEVAFRSADADKEAADVIGCSSLLGFCESAVVSMISSTSMCLKLLMRSLTLSPTAHFFFLGRLCFLFADASFALPTSCISTLATWLPFLGSQLRGSSRAVWELLD